MGSKLITRLGVLAAASTTMLTMAPGLAQAAEPGVEPTVPLSKGAYRIAGLDRYEVSVNAAKVMIADVAKTGVAPKTLVIASGEVWPDAISVTPLSACDDAPVLLVKKDSIPNSVKTFIASQKGKVDRVIISGGTGTVSNAVQEEIRGLLDQKITTDWVKKYPTKANLVAGEWMGNVSIERNGGENRQAVAYNNSAETAECYAGTTNIQKAHDALEDAKLAEQYYQDAVKAYDAARADYATKKAAYDAAVAAEQKLVDQLNALADSLVQVPAASQAAYDAAIAARQASAADLAKKEAAAAVINGLATVQMTTTELDSSMAEYLAKATAEQETAIRAAMGVLGITEAQSLKDAIGVANTAVDAARKDVDSKTEAVSQAALDLQKAAAATAANKETAAKMAAIQEQLNAARATTTAKAADLAFALALMNYSKMVLADATDGRPAPGEIKDLETALDKARTNAVKEAGKAGQVSSFLATGRIYTDALATGPAAANNTGVILLTGNATKNTAELGKYALRWKSEFSALKGSQTVNGQYIPVGGDAIKATGSDAVVRIGGKDRYQVSVNLATKYFKGAVYPTVASGEVYSDATIGGAFSAQYHNPLVLTQNASLPAVVDNYLRNSNETVQPSGAVVMGGKGTITMATFAEIQAAISAK